MIMLSFLIISTQSASIAADQEEGDSEDTLFVGTTSFGEDLDPQNAWDSYSYDIIHQVSEGLFAYDLGDKYLRIVPRLASDCGYWSDDNLEFTVTLREGVTFHNGNPLDGDAVKVSFDRLMHLMEEGVLQIVELYKPLNGEFVINETIVIDHHAVRFYLNYKFAAFPSLLCLTSSMIIDASIMPEDDINHENDMLIGTGPYKFMGNDGDKVEFEFYEDYYRGVPSVKKFTFVKYETSSAISTALLAGDVHMGDHDPDFLISFLGSDKLWVEEPKSGSIITYMGMNNVLINKTFRQAISYAINYDYIIQSLFRNFLIRMTSVVPPGVTYHERQDVATYNVSKARQILIDANLSQGLDKDSEDAEWIALTENLNPIASYNYTFNQGALINTFENDFGAEIQYDLSLIGISLELTPVTWIEYLYKLNFYHDELNLYLYGWMPDYNDPSNIINPLFSNTSISNSAQVNDSWLQKKLMNGLVENDMGDRQQIYYDIQEYVATDLMPLVFIGVNNKISVHSVNVTDLTRNVMDYFYVFSLTWYGEKAEWDAEVYCNTGSTPPGAVDLDSFPTRSDDFPTFVFLIMFGVVVVSFIFFIIIKPSRKINK